MVDNLLREIAIANAPKQAKLVDALTEEAPILGMFPMQPSTHGWYNVYEELEEVTGAQVVNLDGVLPEMSMKTGLHQKDLQALGGIIEVGEDKARAYGGAANYFAQNAARCLKQAGQDMEYALIYKTIRQYAIDNGNYIKAGGSTASSQNSIVAVHYSEGEVTGLYDAKGFGTGKFFDVMSLNGGNVYPRRSDGVLVYGARVKTLFGVQLANSRYVSAMVNIEAAANMTLAKLDDLLDKCRANPANTVLYMRPSTRDLINLLRAGVLTSSPADNNLRTKVLYYNDIPIVTSYNFLKNTEAVVA